MSQLQGRVHGMDQAQPHCHLARYNPYMVHTNTVKYNQFPNLRLTRGLTRGDVYSDMLGGISQSKYTVRCKTCNKDNSTLQRLFKKEPLLKQSLQEKFSNDEESRANFIKRSRGLLGSELKALVETTLTERTSEFAHTKRKRHVDFLDEQDLKKRFADRPEQLANVLANGSSFTHPETGATLYQLTTFTAEHPTPLTSRDVLSVPMRPPCEV